MNHKILLICFLAISAQLCLFSVNKQPFKLRLFNTNTGATHVLERSQPISNKEVKMWLLKIHNLFISPSRTISEQKARALNTARLDEIATFRRSSPNQRPGFVPYNEIFNYNEELEYVVTSDPQQYGLL